VFPSTGVGLNLGMTDAVNLGWKLAAVLDSYHVERSYAGARTMMQTQAQLALRRGQDAAAQALRDVFQELLADEQPARRLGALIAGSDLRYPMPGDGLHPLAGTFAPDLAVRTEHGTTSVAQIMHAARPVFLDLAGRPELRDIAGPWHDRVDIRAAVLAVLAVLAVSAVSAGDRAADALLIRPDARVAWAAAVDEPAATAAPALREALARWFGVPLAAHRA
jgi:hypothetical protein